MLSLHRIRNRQVIGSSPIVGSSKFLRFLHLGAALAAVTFVCDVNCAVLVLLRASPSDFDD
jgi:energy-converting hydrogenase Eha subunit E